MKHILTSLILLMVLTPLQAVEWLYMKEAPYVWEPGRSTWSQLHVSPEHDVWIYHWDTAEWALLYREFTIVPATLVSKILRLRPSEDSEGPGGDRWFYKNNKVEITGFRFQAEGTFSYFRKRGNSEAVVRYAYIYGTPPILYSAVSTLRLTWTSAAGGTYTEHTGTITSIGEVISGETFGTFSWVEIPY